MPINIHGKSYTQVSERVKLLVEENGKDYSLESDYEIHENLVIVKSVLSVNGQKYTGHAIGVLDAYSNDPKAKIIEATETHSHGRALASFGMAGDEFASANEMQDIHQQNGNGQSKPKWERPKSDNSKIWFGKHKGKEWSDESGVPSSYLEWLESNSTMPEAVSLAKDELMRRSGVQQDELAIADDSADDDIPF